MLTNELRETYDGLPETVKSAILALSILIDRIGTLPKADRDDLFELLQEWRNANTTEEQRSIRRAMEEILAQVPLTTRSFPMPEDVVLTRGLKAWAEHVGKRVRELREGVGWIQADLAKASGLPQSHISRIENAEHSPTNFTLQKIAKAFGVSVGEIDPCSE
ncbi:MAG TPA: helix-turn-helix transcriptional regulator [Isosphaeraceae bacterium]|jgi:DNA-binding XRE family transcriptional regulator|nr:helix-turn-helix transcriptional regulator [Isosphaeraceae bacterium]